MSYVTAVLAILKFLATELPKFIKAFSKYRKDTKYKTSKEKIDAAMNEYERTKTLEALKKLEETQ